MDVQRWALRALLLIAVAAVVAGCAAPGLDESAGDDPVPSDNSTDDGQTGCTPEGQVGNGAGDITADRQCPPGDGNMTGPSLP